MDPREFLDSLGSRPNDSQLVEKAISDAMEVGAADLDQWLGQVAEGLGDQTAAQTLATVLESQCRTHKHDDIGPVLTWYAGMVYWKILEKPPKAEFFFRNAAPEGDKAERRFEFYRTYYASRGNWLRLEQFVAEEGARLGMSELDQKKLLARTAHEFGNQGKELSYWQAVAKLVPGDEEADRELERLYEALGRWPSLASHLKNRLGQLPEDAVADRVSVLERMLEIYRDRMRAEVKVMATYQQILAIDPDNFEAMDALLDIYRKAGRWPDFVNVLQTKIERVSDPGLKVELLKELADLLETRLSNPKLAVSTYEQLLELAPRDEVIEKLKGVYERVREFDKLLRLRRMELERQEDPEKKKSILAEMAKFAAERLRKLDVAIQIWEELLELDPAHEEALRSLEFLYEREKRFEDLARCLEKRLELIEDKKERIHVLEKLAQLYGVRLKDGGAALRTWQRILEEAPDNERAKGELRVRYVAEHEWDALEEFLRRHGTVDELARTYDIQVQHVAHPEEKKALLSRAARLWRDELNEPIRAVKDLEQVLSLEPRNLDAALDLIGLYKELSDHRKLPKVYEIAIEKLEDPDRRLELVLETARLHEEKLHDLPQAFFWYVEAFRQDMTSRELRAELERLAGPSRNWDTYVAVLEQAVPIIQDVAEKVSIYKRIGEVYATELKDTENALRVLKEALSLDPEKREIVRALEGLYREVGDYESLADILQRRRKLERREEECTSIAFELADVLYDKLNRPDAAVEVYEEILEARREEQTAYQKLAGLYLKERRFDRLLDVLERHLDMLQGQPGVPDEVLADMWCRIGTLRWGVQGVGMGVVDAYSRALGLMPTHPLALQMLERLVADEGLRLGVVNLLMGPYQQLGRYGDLADLLEIELLERGDSTDTLSLLDELAELYSSKARDERKLFRTLLRRLGVTKAEEGLWDRVEKVAARVEGFARLAEVYGEIAPRIEDTAKRVKLLSRLAQLYWTKLSDLDQARSVLAQVLDLDPENLDALESLEAIYELRQDYRNLLGVCRRRYEIAQFVGDKVAYAFKMADILAEKLDDLDGGIEAVQLVLQSDPDNAAAYRMLDELYGRAEKWEELAVVLRERIRLAEGPRERIELRLRLAAVQEKRLADLPAAVETYREVLDEEPAQEEAVRNLERLSDSDEVRVMVARILLSAYGHQEAFEKMVPLHVVLAEAEEDPLAKVKWYVRASKLCEDRLGDLDRAFAFMADAYRACPDRPGVVDEVLRLGEAREDIGEAVFVLAERVFEIEDEDLRKRVHNTMAELCRDRDIDREMAKRHFAEVLGIDPTDVSAMDALIEMYREDEETELLVNMVMRKADVVADPVDRVRLLSYAGELYHRNLGRNEDAIRTYQSVLEVDPGDLEAMDALEELFETEEQWEPLVDLLGRKADCLEDTERKVEALLKRGGLQRDRLGYTDDAIDTFNRVLALNPHDVTALRALDELYARQEDHVSQCSTLETLGEVLEGDDKVDVVFKMGKLLVEKLADPVRAIKVLGTVLDLKPGHEGALDQLEFLVREDMAAREAFELLAPTLSELGQWERLFVVYDVVTAREPEMPARVRNLLTMGHIAEERLGEPLRAFECYRKAFVEDPRNAETLEKVETLAEAYDLWGDVPEMLLEGAQALEGTPEAVDLRLRAAEVREEKLGDPEGAAKDLEAIVEENPSEIRALERLNRIYTRLEKYQDLARILRLQAEVSATQEQKVAFMLDLATVLEEKLEDYDEAIEVRREVLYLVPGHDGAVQTLRQMFDRGVRRHEVMEILEPIYREKEDFRNLESLYAAVEAEIEDPQERKFCLLRLSEVRSQRLEDFKGAISAMGLALKLDPEDETLALQLGELAERSGMFEELAEVLLEAAEAAEEPDRRVELLVKAAECLWHRVQDEARAEQVYKQVLEISEEYRDALAALERIYEQQGRNEDLLAILEKEAQAAEYEDERVRNLLKAAAVRRDRLADRAGAVVTYRRVLEIDESNLEALKSLRDLYQEGEAWEDLFGILERLSDTAGDSAARAEILRERARIARDKLGQADKALELWNEVAMLLPSDLEALVALQELQLEKGDFGGYIQTCERELELEQTTTERAVELLKGIGRVAEEQLQDEFQAEHAWRRVLELDERDIEAMQALRRLYRAMGDYEALSRILYRLEQSGFLDESELVAVRREHARLLTDELPKPQEAIELWKAVLAREPKDHDALEALARLYEDTGAFEEAVDAVRGLADTTEETEDKIAYLERAAEIRHSRMGDQSGAARILEEVLQISPRRLETFAALEDLYRGVGDFETLADLLIRKDKVLEDPRERVENLSELARTYEYNLQKKEAALLSLLKAAELLAEDEAVLEECWRLAQDSGLYAEYVEHVSAILPNMPEELAVLHLLRLGECAWKKLDRPEEAATYYEQALQRDPEKVEALENLTTLYEALGRHEDLVEVLKKRGSLTEDEFERIQFLSRAALVLIDKLERPQEAKALYRQVLELDELNLEALKALERIHEQAAEWQDLLDILGRLPETDPANELAYRLKVAKVYDERLEDAERAIQAYEEVLAIEPAHPVSLERLQVLYGDSGNWRGLAQVFERLLDSTFDTRDKILLCNRLGILYDEALDDKETALEYYLRVLDLDPEDEEVCETCVRLYSETEKWYELVNFLESRASRTEDPQKKVALMQRAARVYEEKLEDLNGAVGTYSRILEIDPENRDAYANLERLYAAMEQWHDVIEVLLRWKEHVEDKEFCDLMVEAATVAKDRLEDPDRALKLLADALRVAPLHEAAAEKMRAIYGELGDYEAVAKVYLDQEERAPDDDTRARLRAAAGDVYAQKVKDTKRAAEHYERALELNPKMPRVVLALAQAYVQNGQWERAMPLLDILLSETEADVEPARAAEIHYQLGLCAEKLMDLDKALREYQNALRLKEDYVGAIFGLARFYRAKGMWQLALDQYERGLEVARESIGALPEEEEVAVAVAMGEVALEKGDPELAARYLDQVVDKVRDKIRLYELLVRVNEQRGDWAQVVKYKHALVEAEVDPFEKFKKLLEIGDVYHRKMGNAYGAAASYREALSIQPDAKVALLRLFHLYLSTDAVEDALSVLRKLAEVEEDPAKRATYYFQMALLYREKLHDDDMAVQYLNTALDVDPTKLEAFRAIDEILTNNRAWEAQAQNYRKMLKRIQGKGLTDLEYKLYVNLGEIYRSRLGNFEYAISAYAHAAELRPDDYKVHVILADLYERGGKLERAAEEYRAIVMASPLADDAAQAYRSLRDVHLKLKQLDEAFVVTSALVAAGFADEDEHKFYEDNLEPSLPWFKGAIDQLRWETHLMYRGQDPILGHIFRILFEGLGKDLSPKDLKEIRLRKRDEVDLSQQLVVCNVYKAVSKAVPTLPHRMYRDQGFVGTKVEFTMPPALVLGADRFTGQEVRDLAFDLGQYLAYLHPMLFLPAVKSRSELKVYLVAVLKFLHPETPVSTGAEVVEELVRLIDKRMPQQHKNHLQRLGMELLQAYPELNLDDILQDYFEHMERTAIRTGTLVCGSAEAAARCLRSQDVSFSGLDVEERVGEALRFAVSEDHFVLRRALGISIETTT